MHSMAMTSLPAGTEEILEGLHSFLRTEVIAVHDKHADLLDNPRNRYDAKGANVAEVEDLRRQVRMAAAEAGYYTMVVPESVGGSGEGAVTAYAAWELIYRICGPRYWLSHESLAHWATGPSFIFDQVSDAVRSAVLPRLMSGEQTMCFMMSEPGAGSDTWAMRTRAEPNGDGRWKLTGVKQWTTNGPYADHGLVFAVTDPDAVARRKGGITAFLVPTDAPGFRVDSVISLYGHIGGNHGILSLEEVEVTSDQIVGEFGNGLGLGLGGIALGRMYNSAKSVGLARWALDQALDYVVDRKTFGVTLMDHQGIAFPLAECATDIHAAHVLGLDTASRVDAGEPVLKEAAMVKVFSTEMATRVIDRVMQVHGGMGITSETYFAEAWQTVRTVQIADGSAEILRRLIAGRLAKGDRDL
jgi:acyl-CoA dehydrogenase